MDQDDRLRRRDKALIAVLAVLFVVFGAITFLRGDLEQRRHTDAGVYFRAAWAVRTGADPYSVTDDNGWHYLYPPFLAIVAAPFADAPPGASPAPGPSLPYAASLMVWYGLSFAALLAGVHGLAGAIEDTCASPALQRPARFGRRWWSLRLYPTLVCLPMIGHTLGRGQVNLFLVLCVCALAAALMRGRSVIAGLWLALAAAIKIYPAYLLLVPLWRRDARALIACAAGLVVALVIVPVVAMGPTGAAHAYERLYDVLLRDAIVGGPHAAGETEYLHEASGDISSFKSLIFQTLHPDPARRPAIVPQAYQAAHIAICLVVTIVTLIAAGWRRAGDPLSILLFVGALTVALLPMIPTSQAHYFAMAVPLAMGLMATVFERYGALAMPVAWRAFFFVVFVLGIVWEFPALHGLQDFQPVVYAEMLLWGAGVRALWLRRRAQPSPRRGFSTI